MEHTFLTSHTSQHLDGARIWSYGLASSFYFTPWCIVLNYKLRFLAFIRMSIILRYYSEAIGIYGTRRLLRSSINTLGLLILQRQRNLCVCITTGGSFLFFFFFFLNGKLLVVLSVGPLAAESSEPSRTQIRLLR